MMSSTSSVVHRRGGVKRPAEPPVATYEPVRGQRLHQHVVQQLVRRVTCGELQPGVPLPAEPDLARQFGVSRTVIREAVRVLAEKGLVAVRHGSGTRVAAPEHWDHLDPLVIFEQVRAGRDGSFLDEMIEMRRLLETEIAGLAAVRRTAHDLEALQHALAGMGAARHDPDAYAQLDTSFHDAILSAARNRLLREALRPIAETLGVARRLAVHRRKVLIRSLSSHEAIYGAVAAGDAGAAREAMQEHILLFEQDIRAGLLHSQESE
jgi:DNA-binding FadR family transcriptional regulator